MKNSLLFLPLIFLLFACGQRAEMSKTNLQFRIDTSTLVSGSTIDPSDRPTDPLYVAGKGTLEFFGIVVREIPSTVTKDSAGIPVGTIIPPSSMMLTSWTNKTQLINILTTGTAEVNVQIPLGRNLSVTTYMVFIEDEVDTNGPGTLTTVFDVSSAINISAPDQQVVLNVNTSNILDNAKPFVDWMGAFTDPSGNVLANTDIFLRHCMIGFEFSQAMFGPTPQEEDKNFFRTNANGWINSVGISGVDFEIRVGANVVKPCGQPSFTKNYPSGLPAVAFTGFKGAARFNDPGSFNDNILPAANALLFNGAITSTINNLASDPDGDGLTTDQELTSSISNPFIKNYSIKQAFDHDVAGISGPYYDGSNMYFNVQMSAITSPVCSSLTVSDIAFAGSNALTYSPTITTESSDSSWVNCKIALSPTFSVAPADGIYPYLLQVTTSLTDLTTANGRVIPVTLYKPFVVGQGTIPLNAALTSPTASFYLRNKDNDQLIAISPSNILPQLDPNSESDYQIIVKAADLLPGGIFYYSSNSSCSIATTVTDKMINADFEVPGLAVLHLDHRVNFSRDLYLCHRKTFASTSAISLGAIHFAIDPLKSYGSVLAQNSTSYANTYSAGSLVYDSANGRTINCGFDGPTAGITIQPNGGSIISPSFSSTTLFGLSVTKTIGLIHPANGLPTCAYYDDTNRDKIVFVSFDASNIAVEPTAITFPAAAVSGSRFFARGPYLFMVRFDAGGSQLEGRVFDLNSNSMIESFAAGAISTAAIPMTAPAITSDGKFTLATFEVGNVKVYQLLSNTLTLIDSFTPSATPVTVSATSDALGNSYAFTTSSPEGADLYKFNGSSPGSVVFASGTFGAPTGQLWVGAPKNRFTFTDAGQAQSFDGTTFNHLLGVYNTYLFNGIPLNTAAARFMGDDIFFDLYDSTQTLQTTVKISVK